MKRTTILLIILITIVWFLFILISVTLSILLFPPEGLMGLTTLVLSVVRVISGIIALVVWIYFWKKLAEFWLYRLLIRREE